ncbi:glycosyltransferase [Winogradskyella ursingii]|uniref:glycosyltransferase n=1 Tax=Winogradskyella ursingii TaxID=2686079 RepID=UPI0015CCD3EE|nr:glycosyltransferase [Winogradskyella ursingii]
MKILLVGEYNRTHYNIKKGLQTLGHDVKVVSNTDGFKKVEVDLVISEGSNNRLLKLLYHFKLGFIHKYISSFLVKKQFRRHKEFLSGHDIVQFVNEAPFNVTLKSQIKLIDWLRKWNLSAKFFLLSCGLDYPSISYAYDKKFRYSILTPYFEGRIPKGHHAIGLRYLNNNYKQLHTYLYSIISGVIATDLDYHIPLIGHPKYMGMIPHAIDLSSLKFKLPSVKEKIIIFHGINNDNYFKKGNDHFDKALKIIESKYSNKIEIETVRNLPYIEYISRFDRSHILLDQVYAYDQGFNALEAMAMGKIVFTGAEIEWLDYYNVEEDTICINALPDAKEIAKKLEWLILNPNKIVEISEQAREFVALHHDHIKCSMSYLKKWKI